MHIKIYTVDHFCCFAEGLHKMFHMTSCFTILRFVCWKKTTGLSLPAIKASLNGTLFDFLIRQLTNPFFSTWPFSSWKVKHVDQDGIFLNSMARKRDFIKRREEIPKALCTIEEFEKFSAKVWKTVGNSVWTERCLHSAERPSGGGNPLVVKVNFEHRIVPLHGAGVINRTSKHFHWAHWILKK